MLGVSRAPEGPLCIRSPTMDDVPMHVALEMRLRGRVQGVGFRPYVYRLAVRHRLTGWVRNRSGEVEVHVEGESHDVEVFRRALVGDAPPGAVVRECQERTVACAAFEDFRIVSSAADRDGARYVPVDVAPCETCAAELRDAGNPRFRHPFISCTRCGPRYTILGQLPFDRARTAMSVFPTCARCDADYARPQDRRFHAQTIACPDCGPVLSYRARGRAIVTGNEASLAACIGDLRAGKVVAVKGVGGYHLMCDATSERAVARLRGRKHRPDKPLAVMFAEDGRQLSDAAQCSRMQRELMLDAARPVVLVPRRFPGILAEGIAPNLTEIGAMLPSSGVHHLLLDGTGVPLVATSGNLAGEPLVATNTAAESRLGEIADGFLHYDRDIIHAVDDSVCRILDDTPRPMRLARGLAPLELDLPVGVDCPTLAVGGHLKSTVALAWGSRIVVSPHIGDLGSVGTLERFSSTIAALQDIYRVRARRICCDLHPGYASRRWAEDTGLPLVPVAHHHAHASGLAGENPRVPRWLVFTWDGSGLGPDGMLWGGEALLGGPGRWRRIASLRPFRLPGGDRAVREPWRCAASLCWHTERKWHGAQEGEAMVHQAWRRGLNAPWTSSVGRLFDAAAALLGLADTASFEGEAAMRLEACATAGWPSSKIEALPSAPNAAGIWEMDWAPLLPLLLDARHSSGYRAALFHETLARTVCGQATTLRQFHGEFVVGMTGGVFQNRLLAERAATLLRDAGFEVYMPVGIPCNDGGLCYGQVIEVAYRGLDSPGAGRAPMAQGAPEETT